MHPRQYLTALGICVGLALGWMETGCGSQPQAITPSGPETKTGTIPASSASTQTAIKPPDQSKEGTETPTPPPSPFTIVYEQDFQGLELIPMGKIAGIIAGVGYQNNLFAVDSSGIRNDIDMLKGLPGHTERPLKEDEIPPVFSIFSLRGEWPTEGSVFINTPGDRGGTDYMYRLKNGTWVEDKSGTEHSMEYWNAYYMGGLISGTTWKGVDLYELLGQGGHRFIAEGKGKGIPLPRMAPVAKPNKTVEDPCVHQMNSHITLASTKAGDLFGLGQMCVDGESGGIPLWPTSGELAVERWPAGSRDSVVEKLPNGMIRAKSEHANDYGMLLLSASSVYVYANVSPDGSEKDARPYVAHFDGKQWAEVPLPEPGGFISSLFVRDADQKLWVNLNNRMYRRPLVEIEGKESGWERMSPDVPEPLGFFKFGPDNTYWVRLGNDLYRRPGGTGNWEAMPLPTRSTKNEPALFIPKDVVFWDDDVFVVSGAELGESDANISTALLRLKKTPVLNAHIKPPSQEASALVKAATPSCKDVFVVLYKLAKTAPADFDFPLTREALKGRTEFSKATFAETIDGGRRYFVAFTPSYTMGSKLVKLIKDKVKGSAPQLMCGKPKVSRSLRLDLKTGNVIKP